MILTTQAQVDAFNCSEVTGDLTIDGDITDPIANLDGLSSLRSVGSELRIVDIGKLANVDGLSSLTSVSWLKIERSNQLANIDGLSSLTSVAKMITNNHAVLANINGLSSLTSVDVLYLKNNTMLPNVAGLSSLTSVGGVLTIRSNMALTNLDGLSSLVSVGRWLDIREMVYQTKLVRCCGSFPLLNGNGVAGTITLFGNGDGCNSSQGINNGGPCTTAVNGTTWSNLASQRATTSRDGFRPECRTGGMARHGSDGRHDG